MSDPPSGFAPSDRTGPFLDLVGPVYVRDDDATTTLGLFVRPEIVNARGALHGGVTSALLDVALGRNVMRAAEEPVDAVTVSLSVQFVVPSRVGTWIEASGSVSRVGSTLAFADGQLRDVAGNVLAVANALYAVRWPGARVASSTQSTVAVVAARRSATIA